MCAFAVIAVLSGPAAAEPVLWDNGPFVTATGVGAGGADVSVTESGTGFFVGVSCNANLAPPNGPVRVADDFTIAGAGGAGARLSHLYVYSFQTQSGTPTTNVHYAGAYVAVYNGNPNTGGVIIAGDFTTNRILSSAWTGAYRVVSGGLTSASRPITRVDVDMSWATALPNGSYWLVFSLVGDSALSASPNPFAFSVTPHRPTDNAMQYFGGAWLTGSVPGDFPFVLYGRCPADFNGSGAVSVQDLFDFLGAWFAHSPSADFNGANGVTVQDLFDFLGAWFGGC